MGPWSWKHITLWWWWCGCYLCAVHSGFSRVALPTGILAWLVWCRKRFAQWDSPLTDTGVVPTGHQMSKHNNIKPNCISREEPWARTDQISRLLTCSCAVCDWSTQGTIIIAVWDTVGFDLIHVFEFESWPEHTKKVECLTCIHCLGFKLRRRGSIWPLWGERATLEVCPSSCAWMRLQVLAYSWSKEEGSGETSARQNSQGLGRNKITSQCMRSVARRTQATHWRVSGARTILSGVLQRSSKQWENNYLVLLALVLNLNEGQPLSPYLQERWSHSAIKMDWRTMFCDFGSLHPKPCSDKHDKLVKWVAECAWDVVGQEVSSFFHAPIWSPTQWRGNSHTRDEWLNDTFWFCGVLC